MPREVFERRLRENPANDHLIVKEMETVQHEEAVAAEQDPSPPSGIGTVATSIPQSTETIARRMVSQTSKEFIVPLKESGATTVFHDNSPLQPMMVKKPPVVFKLRAYYQTLKNTGPASEQADC